jgi:hypothetical protein
MAVAGNNEQECSSTNLERYNDMNTKKEMTVDLLIKGSRQINEWRKEIDLVCRTLLGLLPGRPLGQDINIKCCGMDGWQVVSVDGFIGAIEFNGDYGRGESRCYYSTRWTASYTTPGYAVKVIRDHLDVLLQTLRTNFSELDRMWRPFLEAAEAAEAKAD